MAVQTTDDFLAILEKSKLVGATGLEQIRQATAKAADAKAVAKFLMQKNVLTRFQAMQLLAGRHGLQIGPYRLTDRIVSSGSGAVYAAESTQTKEPLALKVLPRKLLANKETAAALKQQVKKLKSLDHPGVCGVTSVHVEGEQTLLLMEPAGGVSLGARVAQDGPLPFEAVGDCLCQAAEALAAAHDAGLVHGDLTPDHLICDDQGRLKIVDLGTAGLNPAGVSPDYAAPETSGDSPAGPPADVYSLGCTLYFLLTGKPPFPEGTADEKRQKHQTELPAAVLEFRPDAPPELMKLCIRMMAKDPEKRLRSAAAVIAAVAEWRDAPAAPADDEEGPESVEEGTADSSDETDPEADRALAEAMAAAGFDDQLDEPPPEVTPVSDAAAPAKSAAPAASSDADDILAEAMAASEFDHAIEDEEKADKRKSRLGGVASREITSGGAVVGAVGGSDDLMDELTLQEEPEEESDEAPAEPADAPVGPMVFGLDVFKLLGVKKDDEPAARKKKLMIAGGAGGVLVLIVVALLYMFVFSGGKGDSVAGRKSRRPPRKATQTPKKTPVTPKEADDSDPETEGDGEATDPEGADATSDGTTDGDATDTGEEGTTETGDSTADDTAPPGDGMETEPEGGTGDETTGTTGDEPVEPANPFVNLAAAVDLPRESGAEPDPLGPVAILPEAECTVELMGAAEAGITDVHFTLEDKGVADATRSWYVSVSPAEGVPTIARFAMGNSQLSFQWAGDQSSNEKAQLLRRLALSLKHGTNTHVVALRTPYVDDPVITDFQRINMSTSVDLDWGGDPKTAFVQILKVEGKFPEHTYQEGRDTIPAEDGTTGIFFGEGDDQTLAIKVDSVLTQRLTLTFTPHFKVKAEPKWQPFNVATVNRVGGIINGKIGQKTRSLEAERKKEEKAATRSAKEEAAALIEQYEAELKDLNDSLDQLKKLSSTAKSNQDKGEIHFRVFYKLGDREIDLVRTVEEGGGK